MFPHQTHAAGVLSITSTKNPLLKQIRRAVDRGTLTEDGLCVAEGFHLLEEAIRSGCDIRAVLGAESAWDDVEARVQDLAHAGLMRVADDSFASVAATETTQGVMTLVCPPREDIEAVFRTIPLIVVLDGIQDPGNAGAIVRAAEAFGATGVLMLKGTVNAWNPKTVRASAGSVFRTAMVTGLDGGEVARLLRERGVPVYAAMPRAGRSLSAVDLCSGCAVVFGSEGRGVSLAVAEIATGVAVPTTGVESLNVAVAAAIVLYEASRQRRPS